MKTIALIVLNYKDADTTIKLVDQLAAWKTGELEVRVIVVDNRSPDNSFTILSERYSVYDFIDVIQSEKNGGYSYGNNFGARFALENYSPDYIAIANPDICVDYDTVCSCVDTFLIDNRIGAVAPVMMDPRGNYKIASNHLPKLKDDIDACFESYIKKNNQPPLCIFASDDRLVLTESLPGSFFVIRSDVFTDIGMFDESVFLFCEERILGFRMKSKGYILILRRDLFFLHEHSASIRRAMDVLRVWKATMRSRFYYENKYNKCNSLQLSILFICMQFFLLDLKLRLKFYPIKRKLLCKIADS